MEGLFDVDDPALLDGTLPALPEDLGEGEGVVIARWAGPRSGALLYVLRDGSVDLDATGFRRTPGGWEASNETAALHVVVAWNGDGPVVVEALDAAGVSLGRTGLPILT